MKIVKELLPYVIILVVVVLFRTFIATPIKVDGTSMFPTLNGNEIMILNKLAKVDRYDIVVVDQSPDDIIKRVIGMPGDTIQISDGIVYVDGKKIEDKYAIASDSETQKLKLKKGEYFVLGDNRNNSKDSRTLGPIKKAQIKGTTQLVIFPFTKIGNVE